MLKLSYHILVVWFGLLPGWSKYELLLCLIICFMAVEAFKQTDVDYLKEEMGHAGSTASTAVLLGDRILVANVGDSRVVASRAGLG